MIEEWNAKFVCEGIDDGGADAKASEGARTAHEGDFSEVMESFAVFGKSIAKDAKEFFCHFAPEIFLILETITGFWVGKTNNGVEG